MNDIKWSSLDDDNADKTVVMPTPGGRRAAPEPGREPGGEPARERPSAPPPWEAVGPAASPPPRPAAPAGWSNPGSGVGVNPLVAAASSLLALIAAFRETRAMTDPMGLRARVEDQIRSFAADTKTAQATPETLKAASYCLCTAIDEAVLRTPWGSSSEWRKLSLLRELHGDTWGGQKFFDILKNRMDDPAPNTDLLELLYICLALGFEGQYAIQEDGNRQLDLKVNALYELIRRQRGAPEPDLSPHWRNEEAARVALEHPVPVWVVGAVAASLLLTAYIGFRFFLADASAPVMGGLARFGRDEPQPVIAAVVPDAHRPAPAPVAAPPQPQIAGQLENFLKPEVEQQLVSVMESPTHVTVRLIGSGLFAAGSDQLSPQYVAVIERIRQSIADHQDEVTGDLTVLGHTDNVPLKRSLRFADNYDLSRARAQSVALLLRAGNLIKNAIQTDGKGDSEPVGGGDPATANRTPEQRSANRRVEILIAK